jgi:hypothetical protein
VASEIAVAFIGGGAGLLTGAITGAISSLIAPWANWGIEKRRLNRTSRVGRVKEWRQGVAYLRKAEREHGQPQSVPKLKSWQDKITARPEFITVLPDADLINVDNKPWFRTLRREVSKKTLRNVEVLNRQPLQERTKSLPDVLDEEINRIERDKWDLV